MKPSVVAFGDNVVDCYTDQGTMYPGGNTLNLSVYIQRFGGNGAYIGAVGDDAAGRHIYDALTAENVDVTGLRVLPKESTAFCLIGNRDGDREFLGADLGVSIIEPERHDLDHIARADAVHSGRSSHVDAFLPAFAVRSRLSFDFAVIRNRDRIARIAPLCYLASFSAGDLDDAQAIALLEFALAAGARNALVTRGKDGAWLGQGDQRHYQPAVPTQAVDTLGAGDTFIARTLFGLLIDEAPQKALAGAADAAAKTCCHYGGFGHPAPLEVDRSKARALDEIYGPGETTPA